MMKKITNQKILKVFAMCMLFLGSSQLLLAQNTNPTQNVCEGSSGELYSIIPSANSIYSWSLISGGVFL